MKITSLKAFPISIPYPYTFKSSYGLFRTHDTVLVVMKTDEGIVGVGESCPEIPLVRGTTIGGFLDIMNNYLASALVGEDPFAVAKLHEKMDRAIYGNYTLEVAKAGIDEALHDIIGKKLGIPVVKLLGGPVRDKVQPVDANAPLDHPDTMAKTSKESVDNIGAKWIKVKIGGGRIRGEYPAKSDPDLDVERIRRVREAIGDDVTIIADVNQGYTPNIAIRAIRKLEKYAPLYVEQPVDQDDLESLVHVAKSVDAPIIADECAYTPRMLSKVIQTGIIEYFNLKTMMAGGIYPVMKSVKMIEAAGLKCSIDSVMQTAITDLAQCAVALAVREDALLMTAGGYNSLFHLKDKIIKSGGLKHEKGAYILPDMPGLGCELKDEYLSMADKYQYPRKFT